MLDRLDSRELHDVRFSVWMSSAS